MCTSPHQAAIQASKRGHHFIGVVKTSHARFPKQFLEEHLKDKSAGSRLVLTTKLEGVDLVAMGYKYNKRKVIHFIATAGAANTFDGDDPWSTAGSCAASTSRPTTTSAKAASWTSPTIWLLLC